MTINQPAGGQLSTVERGEDSAVVDTRQARVRKAQASSLYNPSYAGPSVFGWVGGLVFDSTGCIGAALLISCSAGFAAAFAAALPNHD